MFTQTAGFYDAIYALKDYEREASLVRQLAESNQECEGRKLLDVACGTGAHLAYLASHFEAEGLDLDAELLAIARKRNPGLQFHQGDMRELDLGRKFAVITCLFSSIGYVRTVAALRKTLDSFARHLEPGGVAIVEPWFSPSEYHAGRPHARFVDLPGLKVARLDVSQVDGTLSILDFHYLVATSEGVSQFFEHHELGLFTHEEYTGAFEAAGFRVTRDEQGIANRGVYVGRYDP